mgnify:CR=1 FL=1
MSKKPQLNICGRVAGEDYPPLVIAEIGINHEGSLQTAFELVDAAIMAGAEIIKHDGRITCLGQCLGAMAADIPGPAGDKNIFLFLFRHLP